LLVQLAEPAYEQLIDRWKLPKLSNASQRGAAATSLQSKIFELHIEDWSLLGEAAVGL
jgi:hypothetical protein